jgi:hypothetical protein
MVAIGQQLLDLRAEGGALALLAETIDRALMVDQSKFQGGEGAITTGEVAQWAEEVRSGTRGRGVAIAAHGAALESTGYGYQGNQGEVIGGWEAAEDIRRSIYGYRIGQGDVDSAAGVFQETFGLTSEQAAATVRGDSGRLLQRSGGDVSSSITMAGGDWPGQHMPAPEGWKKWEEAEDGDASAQREQALIALKNGFMGELQRIGLDKETIDSLWTWVNGRFTSDSTFSAGQAMVEIYDQPAFIKRFPAIAKMREEKGRRDIPSPEEYLARERNWATYLGEYGMTALGADLDTMVSQSYINAIGEGEFVDRLKTASELIFEAPEAVKTTFGDWFGNHANAALMAVFLDPSKEVFNDNWIGLKGDVAAAEVGGWSKMHLGLNAPVSQERSRAIAGLGWRDIDIWEGLDRIKEREELFVERLGEEDYQMEVEGVAAEFGIDTETMSGVELNELIDRRAARRSADFSGGGGAVLGGKTTGFGATNA